eukprot:3935476-Rhodomonas_salina.2
MRNLCCFARIRLRNWVACAVWSAVSALLHFALTTAIRFCRRLRTVVAARAASSRNAFTLLNTRNPSARAPIIRSCAIRSGNFRMRCVSAIVAAAGHAARTCVAEDQDVGSEERRKLLPTVGIATGTGMGGRDRTAGASLRTAVSGCRGWGVMVPAPIVLLVTALCMSSVTLLPVRFCLFVPLQDSV